MCCANVCAQVCFWGAVFGYTSYSDTLPAWLIALLVLLAVAMLLALVLISLHVQDPHITTFKAHSLLLLLQHTYTLSFSHSLTLH